MEYLEKLVNYISTADGRIDLIFLVLTVITVLLTAITIVIVLSTISYWISLKVKFDRLIEDSVKQIERKMNLDVAKKIEEITIQECEKRIPIIMEDYKPFFPDSVGDDEANNIATSQDIDT